MGLFDEIHIENWIKVMRVTQNYDRPRIDNVYECIQNKLIGCETQFVKGESVAIAVGSRSISNIDLIVKATIDKLKNIGVWPYIISAMGSHGGATAEGQKVILDSLGITSAAMGVPIIYDTEWINLGQTQSGVPVYFSKQALTANKIILINRIKRHTNFRGDLESGLVKMAVVGLGKHKGAISIHARGFEHFYENMLEMFEVIKAHTHIGLGIAIVENAYDETAFIEIIPGKGIVNREKQLLILANAHVPRIPFNNIDVLVVCEMGKDISGDGMDPNITGRFSSLNIPDYNHTPHIARIATLDLTEKSHGSAVGVGYADFITQRLYDKIIPMISYTNAITAKAPGAVKIPPVMPDDRTAIEAAFFTCPNLLMKELRLCIIKNTLDLENMYISKPQLNEVSTGAKIKTDKKEFEITFDEEGNLELYK